MKKRGVRWPFLYAWLIVLSAWTLAHAINNCETPLLPHSDADIEREFQRAYECTSAPTISTGTAQNFTIVNGSATNLNVTGTLTVNGSTALGMVKQVVQGTSTSAKSTTSAAYQTTNLSVSITPSSTSSRIFVVASGNSEQPSGNDECRFTLARGGSNLFGANGMGILFGTAQIEASITMSYLDSPASTSSQTYAVQLKSDGVNTCTFGDGQQSIVAIEIL